METLAPHASTQDDVSVEVALRRPSLTVLVWGGVGLVWLVVALSGWGRWILSDDFTKAPVGGDQISDAHLFWVRVIDWGSAAAGGALAWLALVRPFLRRQGLTADGMIFLACAVSFFIDPVINQFDYTFAWNAHVFNMGSWSAYIPFHSGLAGFGEGIAWAWAQYLYMGFGAAVLGSWIVDRIRHRSPGISNLSAFGALFALYFVADFVLENLFIRTEVYSYARTWKFFTLWDGSQYQFPIYESIAVATFAVGWTYFRMAWMERGTPFVAGGLERLAIGARTRTALTFLAVVGFGAAWVAVTYFIPWSWLSVNADSVAELPSYMLPG
jgi:hypothetical protein